MDDLKLGFRFFLFEPDGTLRGVSNRSFGLLVSRRGALPQFSEQRIRGVEVTVELDGKRPVGIVKTHAGYWVLDSTGGFDADDQLSLVRASMTMAARNKEIVLPWSTNIVDLTQIQKSKQIIAASRWEPNEQEIAQIIGAIWPERRPPGTRRPTFVQITERAIVPD